MRSGGATAPVGLNPSHTDGASVPTYESKVGNEYGVSLWHSFSNSIKSILQGFSRLASRIHAYEVYSIPTRISHQKYHQIADVSTTVFRAHQYRARNTVTYILKQRS